MPKSGKLTGEELNRYARHLVLPEIGIDGQEKLKDARVLIVGVGGLGAPAALYLAAAGVGTIGLVDFDSVVSSNLQRQVLYGSADIGQPKATAAARRLSDLNPLVEIVPHPVKLSPSNALDILRDYSIIVDGTDNYPARYLVNDACVSLGLPDVFASIYRFEGQASVFDARRGPCYRCLFPEPPPPESVASCAEGGVLGALPGTLGLIQATEAMKLVLGRGTPLVGRLLLYDALEMRTRELEIAKDPDCPRCATPERRAAPLEELSAYCQVDEAGVPVVTAPELEAELLRPDPPLLVDVREPGEFAFNRLPGATLIPLGELGRRISEVRGARSVVVYCHLGVRSSTAARHLIDVGIPGVRSLKGGIEAWVAEVDPSMPSY